MRAATLFDHFTGLDSLVRAAQFGPSVRLANDGQTALRFPIDAHETDSAYTVYANLPGVNKDNIQIEVEGQQVKIIASSPAKTEDETLIRRERVGGQFERQFKLAQEVNAESVVAKLENGVLELTLPKKVPTSARKIVVQ